MPDEARTSDEAAEFARAAQTRGPGFLSEFWHFTRHNKRWWLTPIIVILLLLAALIVLSGGGVPFLYPLF